MPLVAIDPRRRGIRILVIATVMAMIDPQHTLHAADDAADGATHHRTHRTGAPVSLVEAMGNSARHALRLRHHRRGENGKNGTHDRNSNFHVPPIC